jgi:hypothetical protein
MTAVQGTVTVAVQTGITTHTLAAAAVAQVMAQTVVVARHLLILVAAVAVLNTAAPVAVQVLLSSVTLVANVVQVALSLPWAGTPSTHLHRLGHSQHDGWAQTPSRYVSERRIDAL